MKVGIGTANEKESALSGKKTGETAISRGDIQKPDFVLAFCSGQTDYKEFFAGLQSVVGKQVPIIGGSAIGIITGDCLMYEGYPAAAAVIQSDMLQCRLAVEGDLDKNEKSAGKRLTEKLASKTDDRLLLIFYDSIKRPATENALPVLNTSCSLIEGMEQNLPSDVPIFGAGLMGDYAMGSTRQFCGSCVDSQSVVGLMLSGNFSPYFRIMHGCTPLDGVYHKITKMEGSAIYELDGKPIVEIIDKIYGNREWRHHHPVDLLTIGVNQGEKFMEPEESKYVNRLITGVLPDGKGISIFEEDLVPGSEIQFMLRDTANMIESAERNSAELMKQIYSEGKKALFGMYIDCAGRTAGYSHTETEEAAQVQKVFNRYHVPLLGFYSGVEIAPFLRKSRGLDWTGVLIVLAGPHPER